MTAIDTLPDAPTRGAQSRPQFVATVDAFFPALNPWAVQVMAVGAETQTAANDAGDARDAAQAAADRAEAAAAAKVSIAVKLWTDLAAITGTSANQSAGVFDDAGTHTDPVVGGTVDNAGVYGWSVSPAGWKRLGDIAGGAVAWASVTGKPSTFAPSAHTHAQSDITNLTTDLAARALTGAIGSSGLTMATGVLLGRYTASTGAVEAITLGSGLSIDGSGVLTADPADMVYPGSGIAVSSGSGWSASLAIPTGGLVGVSASQTLTNKTLGSGTVISSGTDSGLTKTGGEIRAGVTISDTGTIAATSPGFRGLPNVSVTNRTIVAADMGKNVEFSGTVTFPTGLPEGFACTLDNKSNSASSIATSGGQLLRKNKSTSTASSATLAARGTAGAWKNAAGEIKLAGDIS